MGVKLEVLQKYKLINTSLTEVQNRLDFFVNFL